MHPYEAIPLATAGLIAGLWLIFLHGLMLWRSDAAKAWLKKLPRNTNAGVYVLAVGMLWFWLLVAPERISGSMSFLGALSMDLGDFNRLKPILRLLVPVAYFGMIFYVKEFLFVRGLGVVALMAAAPLLDAAFLKEPGSRVLLSAFAYVMLTKGMFWVGMPYTFRDAVTWVTKSDTRWKGAVIAGLAYGVILLLLSLTSWRGY
ncbi:MAG: hypothetical protein Q7Q71_09665 [Verrucomicrobiota bacterium JB023]|nr:hypothetical protein [Verrucomicrobiota bacterium JB023]